MIKMEPAPSDSRCYLQLMENELDDSIGDALARWPALGDRLFVDPGWKLGAHIATFGGERHYRLTKGYKTAGDLLVQHAEQIAHERANLVYPVVFCYRQYVELALKGLVEDYGSRVGILPIRNSHLLMKDIWPAFVSMLTGIGGTDLDGPDVQAVLACVEELDREDQRSMAFRYATDTKGQQPALPNAIDLFHLRDVMTGIENFFDCIALSLDAKEDEVSDLYPSE